MIRLGYVDFSSYNCTHVQEVLALLNQHGTLDELRIRQVQDVFSELLFPGFSTIQTRTRYFLAVPYILLDWASLPLGKRRRWPRAPTISQPYRPRAAKPHRNYRRTHDWAESRCGLLLKVRIRLQGRPHSQRTCSDESVRRASSVSMHYSSLCLVQRLSCGRATLSSAVCRKVNQRRMV
jgi:hypothetical protein